jgi:hypothetical protein
MVQLAIPALVVGLSMQLDGRLSELDEGLELKVTVPVGVIGVPKRKKGSLTVTVHEFTAFTITGEVQLIDVDVGRPKIVITALVPELGPLFESPG